MYWSVAMYCSSMFLTWSCTMCWSGMYWSVTMPVAALWTKTNAVLSLLTTPSARSWWPLCRGAIVHLQASGAYGGGCKCHGKPRMPHCLVLGHGRRRGCACSSRRPLQGVAWAGCEVVVTVSSSACKCGIEAVVFVRVSLAQQQLKHMYMALATAQQFASFVLLCVILKHWLR